MILLTGATGTVGSALLRRLTRGGEPVRCLVRDPRRLGDHRVRVQLAMGDLADPPSFRNALRGVHTVIHLAASIRDEPRASIEELNAMATLRLVRAAERAGARRFVFFSALGAEHHSRTRFFRAKALAEQAVEASPLEHGGVLSLDRLHAGRSVDDAARAVLLPARHPGVRLGPLALPADLGGGRGRLRGGEPWPPTATATAATSSPARRRSPTTTSCAIAMRPTGRRRRLLHVPLPVVRTSLRGLGRAVGPRAFATWEEAELMEEPMTSGRGTADAEALGVTPLAMPAVVGGA